MGDYQVCSRCVMDTSASEIHFDEDGVCNFCREYEALALKVIRPKIALSRQFELIKNRRGEAPYDAILGVSGGADSSFTAVVAKRHGLNVLLLHFDNGYDTPEGVHNIEALVDYTGFDYVVDSCDLEEFTDLQRSYLKAGVINLEAPSDHGIIASVYGEARFRGIKTMLSGSNWATEGILPQSWGHRNTDRVNLEAIHKRHGLVPLISFPRMGLPRIYWLRKVWGLEKFCPLNYGRYFRRKAIISMRNLFGFEDYGVKHGESVITRFYQNYILPWRWGVDKRRAHYSSQICSGEITRENALSLLEENPWDYDELFRDHKRVASTLKMSTDKLHDLILDVPLRSHREYASGDSLYQLGRSLKRRLWG